MLLTTKLDPVHLFSTATFKHAVKVIRSFRACRSKDYPEFFHMPFSAPFIEFDIVTLAENKHEIEIIRRTGRMNCDPVEWNFFIVFEMCFLCLQRNGFATKTDDAGGGTYCVSILC